MSREKLILAFWQKLREKNFYQMVSKKLWHHRNGEKITKKTFQNFFVLRSLIIYESCVGKYRLHV